MSKDPWELRLTRRAEKDLAKLDSPVRKRVTSAIRTLAADPEGASAIRKLSGRPEWRLRIGDWRALFVLEREQRQIVIHRVAPRGRAYDR